MIDLSTYKFAVDAIFKQIGTITNISAVYQTPALGFDGADFLNCVLVLQTPYKAQFVLKEILSIEKTLGRQRSKGAGYASRVIDIDILFYNQQVYKSSTFAGASPADGSPKICTPALGRYFSTDGASCFTKDTGGYVITHKRYQCGGTNKPKSCLTQ